MGGQKQRITRCNFRCSASFILMRRFANEIGALQAIVEARGHILILSPKVEYSWGKAKMTFRRETNDCVAKNLHCNIVEALKVVTLERVWKYERKTRDYRRRMYVDIAKKVELEKIKS